MIAPLFQLFRRALVSRSRIAALLALGAVGVLLGAVVGSSDPTTRDAVELLSDYGLTVVVPLASLVFASASFGDLREDRTLVYLTMKPIPRWQPVVAAHLASVTIVLPVVVIPLLITALVTGSGGDVVGGIVLAASVGVVVYTALFTLAGLVFRRPLLWGLVYILVWEGFIAAAGKVASNVAMRSYTRSILARMTDTSLGQADSNLPTAIIVPVIVALVALAFATWRLKTMDID